MREGLRTPHGYPLKGENQTVLATEYASTQLKSSRIKSRNEKAMSAANVTTRVDTEIDLVEQWRHEALWRAGYNAEAAVVLAASHDVDLHLAVDLLERGCSQELALQILL